MDIFKVPKVPHKLVKQNAKQQITLAEDKTREECVASVDSMTGILPDEKVDETLDHQELQNIISDKNQHPELSYTEPMWSGRPVEAYHLLVIKNGVEVDTIKLTDKSFCTFGRLPTCHVQLEHPSVSRYHAILQHCPRSESVTEESTINKRESGFYLYDLSSTHGTFLNKSKIQPRCYYRMRIGQSVKFGGSSRIFVLDQALDSCQEIVEAEAEEEIADIRRKQKEYQEHLQKAKEERERRLQEREEMGATWGILMDDMITGEEDRLEEIEIDPEREAYYVDDPKKTLKRFFDREGLELEYECEETEPSSNKTYTVRVCLPIDTITGESVYAEASVMGKKKDAVIECALQACRMLDAEGILRQSKHNQKRKQEEWEENDYYDSDEDNFFDRTGDIDKKRKKRMIKAGKLSETVETYQSLANKLTFVQNEIKQLQLKLNKSTEEMSISGKGDSLDEYMKTVSNQLDKRKQSDMKLQIHQLKKEEENLKKLINVAKPYELPGFNSIITHAPERQTSPPKNISSKSSKTEVLINEKDSRHTDTKRGIDVQSKQQEILLKLEHDDHSITTASPTSSSCLGTSDIQFNLPSDNRKRMKAPTLPPAKRKVPPINVSKWEGDSDPDFVSWMPPEDQIGDGRTKLNEKLGY